MVQDLELEQKSKMEILMEIVKLMKQLQGDSMKPKAVELEVHSEVPPMDAEMSSHEEDGSEEESPEEEASDLSQDLDLESPEQDQEESSEMELPEAFKKLLAEKLKR